MLATAICLISRAVNVYPTCFVCNLWRRHKKKDISLRMQFVLWLSGLRGAIAFALAFDARSDTFFDPGNDGPAIFSATVFIIFFTIFVTGSPMAAILRKLGMLQDPHSIDDATPLSGRAARIALLDERYLGRLFLYPKGARPCEMELTVSNRFSRDEGQGDAREVNVVMAVAGEADGE